MPRLDMMSSGTLRWEEWILQGLEVGEGLDTQVSGRQRWEGKLPSSIWDSGEQRLPGTHVVVMISSLVLRISSTGPWYLQRRALWGGSAQREMVTNGHPQPWASASPRSEKIFKNGHCPKSGFTGRSAQIPS